MRKEKKASKPRSSSSSNATAATSSASDDERLSPAEAAVLAVTDRKITAERRFHTARECLMSLLRAWSPSPYEQRLTPDDVRLLVRVSYQFADELIATSTEGQISDAPANGIAEQLAKHNAQLEETLRAAAATLDATRAKMSALASVPERLAAAEVAAADELDAARARETHLRAENDDLRKERARAVDRADRLAITLNEVQRAIGALPPAEHAALIPVFNAIGAVLDHRDGAGQPS